MKPPKCTGWCDTFMPEFADGCGLTACPMNITTSPFSSDAPRLRGHDRVHTRKILSVYFDAILDGDKRCEVRREGNGIHFEADDVLRLQEWVPSREGGPYTGRELFAIVTHVTRQLEGVTSLGLEDGVVVLSIELIRGGRRWFDDGDAS